jgi:hypothetical protein
MLVCSTLAGYARSVGAYLPGSGSDVMRQQSADLAPKLCQAFKKVLIRWLSPFDGNAPERAQHDLVFLGNVRSAPIEDWDAPDGL